MRGFNEAEDTAIKAIVLAVVAILLVVISREFVEQYRRAQQCAQSGWDGHEPLHDTCFITVYNQFSGEATTFSVPRSDATDESLRGILEHLRHERLAAGAK